MIRITIIGGGASGTLLAANLLREGGDQGLEINLVEKRSAIDRAAWLMLSTWASTPCQMA